MPRPYYHYSSKSGAMPIRDTKIKRSDVMVAVQQYADERKMMHVESQAQQHERYSFLDLPGEVRNRIYEFTLDAGTKENPRIWIPKSSGNPVPHDQGLNLFRLCKQINYETRTMIEATDISYVPIMAAMDFASLVADSLKYSIRTLAPAQSTIMNSLTMSKNLHIHLHINHQPNPDPNDNEPYIESLSCNILGRLRQALIIFTSASALAARSATATGRRTPQRRCIVHFDHLYSDWRNMQRPTGVYSFGHMVNIMGHDATTQWAVKYYVYTTQAERDEDNWLELDGVLASQFDHFQGLCNRYPNIKLTAELYGEKTWSLEGRRNDVTRSVTPGSILWPSWPDYVPWRMYPRVDALSDASLEEVAASPPLEVNVDPEPSLAETSDRAANSWR